jgi:amidohydrolase
MPDSKQVAQEAVEAALVDLVQLSHEIHDCPETAFEEVRSAALACEALAGAGLSVTTGTAGMPTAFSAEVGDGPLVLAICAEYDALPRIGHACGHNIIAASAVGAGLGLAPLADRLGMTVRVLGTPAEEGGGGKVIMLDAGVFEDVHAAMMVHPWPEDRLEATCLAVDHVAVRYHGRDAHASASPEKGINAGDAFVVAQVAIGLLRQHLDPGNQVHGIVEKGGDAPNIVPREATGRFMMRARSLADLSRLRPRIEHCFEAGALATGATLEIEDLSPTYSHFEGDPGLTALWRANAQDLGRHYTADEDGSARPTISTDMANVSLALPSIHPMIGVDARGAVNHQPEFAAACLGPSAEAALYDGALAMAWTAIDAASDPAVRDRLLAGRP